MPKKRISLVCLSIIGMIVLMLLAAGVALKFEPHFYRTPTIEPSAERTERSNKVVNQLLQLVVDLKFQQDGWHHDFKDVEINSFFQEDFAKPGGPENLHNMGVSEPRVAFDEGRIRLAFRYGHGFWSTVVSCDLRAWVVSKETNVLAIEVLSRRAGALPIPEQALLSQLGELLAKRNIEVTPYRHEGHLVALLRFQGENPRPMAQLRCVQTTLGKLSIEASTDAQAHGPTGN